MQINHNGQVLPADAPIFTAQNRSFRYGDGLFESIRAFDGKLPFFQYHWQRLMAGLGCLGIEKPPHYSPDFFQNEIAKLTNNRGNWRIRLTVWRSGGGFYTPETNQPEFLIEAVPLGEKSGGDLESPLDLGHKLNPIGLSVGIWLGVTLPCAKSGGDLKSPPDLWQQLPVCAKSGGDSKSPPDLWQQLPVCAKSGGDSKSPPDLWQQLPVCAKSGGDLKSPPDLGHSPISNFKLTSALPYVLAAQCKQANGHDDCLLLNTAGRLACATSANIFWVKNGKLFTPPLSEGCVAGTMRAVLFDIAKAMKIKVQEKKGKLADLAEAEEVFLTNAIQGIRWVKEIQGTEQRYGHELAERMVAALNEKMAGLITF